MPTDNKKELEEIRQKLEKLSKKQFRARVQEWEDKYTRILEVERDRATTLNDLAPENLPQYYWTLEDVILMKAIHPEWKFG